MNHKLHPFLSGSIALLLAACTGLVPTPPPDNAPSAGANRGGNGGNGASGGQAPMPGASGGNGVAGGTPGSSGGGSGGKGGADAGASIDTRPGATGGAGGNSPSGGSVGSDAGGDQAPVAEDTAPPPPPPIPPTGAACPAGPFGDPLPVNRVATLIKGMAGSLEGPLWVAAQNTLYFCVVSGVPSMGRIDKYVLANNQFGNFVSGVDVAGLALSPQGAIVAAAFDRRNLAQFDLTTGKRTDIAGSDSYNGKPFDQTNDLVIRSDGNIYFTDTDYRQDGRPGQETTAYYRLSPAGKVTRIAAGSEPNGIALSPNGRWLYVSSTGGDPVRRYALDDEGGVVGAATTFNPSSSDGMTVDCAGNVYLSSAGTIKVLAPDGKMLGAITGLGTSTVSNAAFGGADYKTLFITTASALYQIKMNVPGFPN